MNCCCARWRAAASLEREWAMLLSLHTGLRAIELAQVKLDSIRTARGVLVIAVEEQLKNI
jgi:hypothetical protein